MDDARFVKFHNRRRDSRIGEAVWAAVEQSPIHAGVVIHHGTIVDSTMVKGACRHGSIRKDGGLVDEDSHCRARVGFGQGSGVWCLRWCVLSTELI